MSAVWADETKFRKWLDVEIAACAAHVKLGNISQADFDVIQEKADFDVARIKEIEAEVNHDVIAFLTNVAEYVGEPSRFVHLGLTSSDVGDTALCLLIQDAGNILLKDIYELMQALKVQAEAHKFTLCMGRTHGVHAEPTTFGLKLTVFYEELKRGKEKLKASLEELRVGLVSGAVGNYAHMPPELETLTCEALGLKPASISTQILQRDSHATFVSTLAVIGGTLDRLATEIRGLQKTEFNEVQEPFSAKQKGSSAMPHKRNPITCERISGLSRVLRGYAVTAFENQPLWHERDISHSGAERVILPDSTIALDYMFGLMTRVVSGLVVNEDAMMDNIGCSYYVFYSQQLLLKLVDSGMSREDAYRLVQKNALGAFDEKLMFEEKVFADSEITDRVSKDVLEAIFSLDKYKAHVEAIYQRVYS